MAPRPSPHLTLGTHPPGLRQLPWELSWRGCSGDCTPEKAVQLPLARLPHSAAHPRGVTQPWPGHSQTVRALQPA